MEELNSLAKKIHERLKVTDKNAVDTELLATFIDDLFYVLFPERRASFSLSPIDIEANFSNLQCQLKRLFSVMCKDEAECAKKIQGFFASLENVYESLLLDAKSFMENDPAAKSLNEVVLCYPGFKAIFCYRIAHEFYQLEIPLIPRLITEWAHSKTGIDIHPGAKIGKYFFIDHGTGVVIGETTVVGDHVKIYQGVTLGALSVHVGLKGVKRHPTIEDHVVIYSNATVLGGETVIGKGSIIGGNVWLTKSTEENSVVYHKSEVKTGVKNTRDFHFEK